MATHPECRRVAAIFEHAQQGEANQAGEIGAIGLNRRST